MEKIKFNPFAGLFNKRHHEQDITTRQKLTNAQGYSQEELNYGQFQATSESNGNLGYSDLRVQFEQNLQNKIFKIHKYKEMSFFPEIKDALDKLADEATTPDDQGNIMSLDFNKEVPKFIEEDIRKEWKYIINDVFNIRENVWQLYRRFMVESELYMELIVNDDGTNVIGFKVLPSFTMYPVYSHDEIVAFVQTKNSNVINQLSSNVNSFSSLSQDADDGDIVFEKDQVVYSYFGELGESYQDVKGYLESCVRPYNQLKNLEDASVINKIARAPLRRVFTVDVGRMPKSRGEEYMHGLIQRYKKRIKYDSATGAMDASENFTSMLEDFWFTKGGDNNGGSTVTNLEGAATFDNMEMEKYFRIKLYSALGLPTSRWRNSETPSLYSSGNTNEVTREEISFANFVERTQIKFKYLFLDAFLAQLRLRGIAEQYTTPSLYNIRFNKTNQFELHKELSVLESRAAVLTTLDTYVYKEDMNPGGYFDPEFVLKKYFKMSDEEYNENLSMLMKTKKRATAVAPASGEAPHSDMDSGMGDFGDMSGGTDMSASITDAGIGDEGMDSGEMGGTEETGGAESFRYTSGKTLLKEFANIFNNGKEYGKE